jgi:hypothetical protein
VSPNKACSPPPASASVEEIAEQLVEEFGKWRETLNGC